MRHPFLGLIAVLSLLEGNGLQPSPLLPAPLTTPSVPSALAPAIIRVSGIVRDDRGAALPGVMVRVARLRSGEWEAVGSGLTDTDGAYELEFGAALEGYAFIRTGKAGYEPSHRHVRLEAERVTQDLRLATSHIDGGVR